MSANIPAVPGGLPAPTDVEVRVQALEKRVAELKPQGKDGWDKFEKLSTVIWGVVTLLVSVFVTDRIESALKERQLHLENVKDMQQLMQDLDKASASIAMSDALALGAHGRYAVAPLIQVLQTGVVDHREAAVAGLRAAAAVDGDFVCQQLAGVIGNHTRLYQMEVHESAAKLLGDLDCKGAVEPLQRYVSRLERASPQTAPFTAVPGSQGLTQDNIGGVKKQAQDSLDALTQP
jgi:translation elongation factor EF-1beta